MKMMKVEWVFLLVLLVIVSASEAVPGSWIPINDINDPYLVEIANFAVDEYDKQYDGKLKLGRVINGDTQVVIGINYRLILAANDGMNYQAIVWDKPWQHFRNLTSFNPIQRF